MRKLLLGALAVLALSFLAGLAIFAELGGSLFATGY